MSKEKSIKNFNKMKLLAECAAEGWDVEVCKQFTKKELFAALTDGEEPQSQFGAGAPEEMFAEEAEVIAALADESPAAEAPKAPRAAKVKPVALVEAFAHVRSCKIGDKRIAAGVGTPCKALGKFAARVNTLPGSPGVVHIVAESAESMESVLRLLETRVKFGETSYEYGPESIIRAKSVIEGKAA
jgi:hypothetical protein